MAGRQAWGLYKRHMCNCGAGVNCTTTTQPSQSICIRRPPWCELPAPFAAGCQPRLARLRAAAPAPARCSREGTLHRGPAAGLDMQGWAQGTAGRQAARRAALHATSLHTLPATHPHLFDARLPKVVHIAVAHRSSPRGCRPRSCCAASRRAGGAALCRARRWAAAGGAAAATGCSAGSLGCSIGGSCLCPWQPQQLLFGACNAQRQQLRVHSGQHRQLVPEEQHGGAAARRVCRRGGMGETGTGSQQWGASADQQESHRA